MHALHAALAGRGDAASPAVAELLAALQAAGPDLTTMDVLICSFGGVGSTQLSNHLNAHGFTTNLLTDTDNLRHCPRPPSFAAGTAAQVPAPGPAADASAAASSSGASSSGGRGSGNSPGAVRPAAPAHPAVRPRHVVYLYGDPLAAVASHYRRGHACHQAQKTCGDPARLSAASFPPTFEEYVARGEDLFGLEEHFRAWAQEPADYPIVLLRYEAMFEPAVCGPLFARLAAHRPGGGALARRMADSWAGSWRKRKSQVPPESYDAIYGSLRAAMDALPPLHVRPASGAAAR